MEDRQSLVSGTDTQIKGSVTRVHFYACEVVGTDPDGHELTQYNFTYFLSGENIERQGRLNYHNGNILYVIAEGASDDQREMIREIFRQYLKIENDKLKSE